MTPTCVKLVREVGALLSSFTQIRVAAFGRGTSPLICSHVSAAVSWCWPDVKSDALSRSRSTSFLGFSPRASQQRLQNMLLISRLFLEP